MIKVLDKGHVVLDDFMGGDLKAVNMARGSYGKRHEVMEMGDPELLDWIMKERHGVPFEHCVFTFHVKCPISVAREWFRHRIGSFSEISGRYVKLEPEFYVPEGGAIRTQIGKSGRYTFVPLEEDSHGYVTMLLKNAYRYADDIYNTLLRLGLAKEAARNILPVGIYTQFYWTVNARSLMNFLNLRTADNAMWEIRQFAQAIEQIYSEKMPISHKSFIDCGKVAP